MLVIPLLAIALVLIMNVIPWYTNKQRRRKETSSRMWMRTLVFVALIAIVWWALFMPWINKDWVSDVEVVNSEGTAGTAYIAYYPGRSTFAKDVADAFVTGLVDNGWRCEITTASSQAPTNLDRYDLVALVSPTYMLQPAGRVTRYVGKLDLGGKDVVIISSGLFSTKQAATSLAERVRAAGGNPIQTVEVKTGAGMAGMVNPRDVAREAGAAVPLP